MALGATRKRLRILSITTAASMIEDYVEQGTEGKEIGLTDDEMDILEQENKKIAALLYAMAAKLKGTS